MERERRRQENFRSKETFNVTRSQEALKLTYVYKFLEPGRVKSLSRDECHLQYTVSSYRLSTMDPVEINEPVLTALISQLSKNV